VQVSPVRAHPPSSPRSMTLRCPVPTRGLTGDHAAVVGQPLSGQWATCVRSPVEIPQERSAPVASSWCVSLESALPSAAMTSLGPSGSTDVVSRASSFTLGGIAYDPWHFAIAASCLPRFGVSHPLTTLQ
jgi:hypothetical protein